MNNKYRGVQDLNSIGQADRSPDNVDGRFDGGIVTHISPQMIELNASPKSDITRVERGALRQDYDVTDVGTAATTAILALGEHRYVVTGDTLYAALFRMYLTSLSVATVEIDLYDESAGWVAAIDDGGTDSLTLERVLCSWKSFFAQVFFATAGDILRWTRSSSYAAQSADFTAGNALTALSDTVIATVSPAVAVNSVYTMNYSVTLTGPSAAGGQIVLAWIDGGASVVDSLTYNFPASSDTNRSLVYSHETRDIIAAVTSGQTITMKLFLWTKAPYVRQDTMVDVASLDFQATKTEARAAEGDGYDFIFVTAGAGTYDARFSYDTGAGWVVAGTQVALTPDSWHFAFILPTMGAGDKFRIEFINLTDIISVDSAYVEWDEPFEVSVHGFNVAVDADPIQGVTYQTETGIANVLIDVPKSITSVTTGTATGGGAATLTDSGAPWSAAAEVGNWVYLTDGTGVGQLRKITSNTTTELTVRPGWTTQPVGASTVYQVGVPTYAEARYLGTFNNRLLLLQDDGDPQKISWSINGSPEILFGDGAGEIILPGYSDPVDELMAFEALSSSVGALFRIRSIERVVATGTAAAAHAFFRWVEEVGTESPFSVTVVPGGLMFLGHDRMVYYLTETSITSVGESIREGFLNSTDFGTLAQIEGNYDPISQDYIMSSPEQAVTWFFDMDRFAREGVKIWQRHSKSMGRLAISEGTDVYFTDVATKTVHTFDRTAVEAGAYWISPQLNRKNLSADYSLHRVELRYEVDAVTPVIIIEGSADGGVTWKDGYKTSITLVDSATAVFKVAQGFDNVTGSDLRFRVSFDTVGKVLLHGWRAELLERGHSGDDIT